MSLTILLDQLSVAQRETKSRPLVWEDEPSGEPRFRRAQAGAPLRGLPGMPIAMDELEDEEPAGRKKSRRFSEDPVRPWWRPETRFARVLLGAGALAVVSAFAIAAFAVEHFLERDPRFLIAGTSNIQATGLAEVTRSEMLPVFGEDIGRNIFFVPLRERRKQLEQIPWIEQATVMRLLPDQIRVSVVERKPVAFVRQGSQIQLVDANGVLLTMPAALMTQHHYSFPVVTGIDTPDPLIARKNRMATYLRLVGELDGGGQHLSDQISEIDLTNPEDARVLMPEQGTDILAHFGEDHFLDRFQRYKAHIAEWRQQYPRLAEVDLRYDQQVVLQMTGTNSTPTPAALDPGKAEATTKPPAAPTPRKLAASPEPVKHAQAIKPSKPAKPHVAAAPPRAKATAKKKPIVKKTAHPSSKTAAHKHVPAKPVRSVK